MKPNGARGPPPAHACRWPIAQPARAGRPPGWANSQLAQARWPDQLAGTLAKHAQFSQDWRCPFALRWLLGAFAPSATSYMLNARTTNPKQKHLSGHTNFQVGTLAFTRGHSCTENGYPDFFQSGDAFIFGQGSVKGPTNFHSFYFEVLRRNRGTIPVVSPLGGCGPSWPYWAQGLLQPYWALWGAQGTPLGRRWSEPAGANMRPRGAACAFFGTPIGQLVRPV